MGGWFCFSSRRRHTRFDCDWSSDVCSSDLVLSDLDRREGLAKRLPEVPEAVVAREKAVCEAARPAVQLQCERVQVIVDRVTRVGERQAGLIGPPTRVTRSTITCTKGCGGRSCLAFR